MQVSLEKTQSPPAQKVKNILIRSFPRERQDNNPHNLEASYVLKYSPKYYKSLTIEIRPYSPLLSKIKKIKKLQKLEGRTGNSFQQILPQKLWFNLLGNNRKEIEESPQIYPNNFVVQLNRSFWRRMNLQKIKFFPNVTRFLLSKWGIYGMRNDSDPFVTIKELFVQYFWNLRKLKSLEIRVKEDNYEETRWVFEKLEGMKGLFGRLETFFIDIETENSNVQKLFQNKNLFSHVTGLGLSVPFDPIFAEIPQVCKKLRYLSLDFAQEINERLEFRNLFTSIQNLDNLKSLFFRWPDEARDFWGYLKPQSSLRQLELVFSASNLINEGLFGEDLEPNNAVEHWEDIQELDVLTFHVNYEEDEGEQIIIAKQFITMILKKIKKVHSLRYFMTGVMTADEPFFVEEVPHIYETLERFEHSLSNWSVKGSIKFDLKMMKPFKKLKQLRLDGSQITYENVEEVMSLLEENHKEGDERSVLEIESYSMSDQNWLGETLKKIDGVKKASHHLEMLIDLAFSTENLVGLLETLCKDIQAVKTIKELIISLKLFGSNDDYAPSVERIREILEEYSRIDNLKLLLDIGNNVIIYRKLDGEKKQFSIIHI